MKWNAICCGQTNRSTHLSSVTLRPLTWNTDRLTCENYGGDPSGGLNRQRDMSSQSSHNIATVSEHKSGHTEPRDRPLNRNQARLTEAAGGSRGARPPLTPRRNRWRRRARDIAWNVFCPSAGRKRALFCMTRQIEVIGNYSLLIRRGLGQPTFLSFRMLLPEDSGEGMRYSCWAAQDNFTVVLLFLTFSSRGDEWPSSSFFLTFFFLHRTFSLITVASLNGCAEAEVPRSHLSSPSLRCITDTSHLIWHTRWTVSHIHGNVFSRVHLGRRPQRGGLLKKS